MSSNIDPLLFLKNFVRESSREKLASYCAVSSVKCRKYDLDSETIFERVTSILLWGSPGRARLEFQFNLESAVQLASIGLGKNQEDIDDDIALDFMREFSNTHAGYLRGVFENAGERFGVSLPFILSGSAERTQSGMDGAEKMSTSWILSLDSTEIVGTLDLEIVDRQKMEALQVHLTATMGKSVDQGDVNFFDE
jgi:CheY-specific phosphatase CheX